MDRNYKDLTLLAAKKTSQLGDPDVDLDPRLFNAHNSALLLIVSPPRTGKSNLLLSLLGNSNFLKFYYKNIYFIGSSNKTRYNP